MHHIYYQADKNNAVSYTHLAEVTPVTLIEAGILKNVRDGVRILGNGELTKKLTVIANGFTKSAEAKITAAGGKVEVI